MPVPKLERMCIVQHTNLYLEALEMGKIKMKPDVTSVSGNTLILSDGQKIECDTVILCTGYRIRFPFLDNSLNPLSKSPIFPKFPDGYRNDYCELYKFVVHPEFPSLFFLGCFDGFGNNVVMSSMQARWVSGILSEEIKLPNKKEMIEWIDAKKQKDIIRGGFPMFRSYVPFMDIYATDLKCIPTNSTWPEELPVVQGYFDKENWSNFDEITKRMKSAKL